MDQCHTARSPANSSPAAIMQVPVAQRNFAACRSRLPISDHAHRKGSASATRQKPVATGPVSLTLTNRGEARDRHCAGEERGDGHSAPGRPGV